jgi:hypothetical protein
MGKCKSRPRLTTMSMEGKVTEAIIIDLDCDGMYDWCLPIQPGQNATESTILIDESPARLVDSRGNNPVICARLVVDSLGSWHEGCVAS